MEEQPDYIFIGNDEEFETISITLPEEKIWVAKVDLNELKRKGKLDVKPKQMLKSKFDKITISEASE